MIQKLYTPSKRKTFHFGFSLDDEFITITTEKGYEHQYLKRALEDLYLWLWEEKQGGWVFLGSTGEENTPQPDTVEAWARAKENPIGGFYGITAGRKGRFSSYIPSILEFQGFAEIENKSQNIRMRALSA